MKVESGKKYPKSQSMLSIQVPGTGLDYFPKVNVCVRNTGSMTVSAEAKSTCDKVVKIAEDCKYLVDGFRDKTLIPLSYRSSCWTKCWCLQSCKYRGHNNKRKWSFSCCESPIRLIWQFQLLCVLWQFLFYAGEIYHSLTAWLTSPDAYTTWERWHKNDLKNNFGHSLLMLRQKENDISLVKPPRQVGEQLIWT